MHERTRLEDELSPEELAELEQEAELALQEPSDHEKMRAWHLTERVFAGDWAVIGLASLIAVLLFVGLIARETSAQDTTLTAPYPINGRIYTWPAIGTDAYSASCTVYQAWEDGSAYASCWEDGASYVFDPEDGEWSPMTSTR